MPQEQYGAVKVRVELLDQNSRVVAEKTVTGSHAFRLATAPGSYVLRSNQPGTAARAVKLADGQRKTVNLYSTCS
jgi:hypothetical protein